MTIDQSVADATVNSAAANQEWKDVMFPLYASADAEIYWSGTFIRPCGTTAQNTQYGLYRYTNGSPYPERHAGIDYDCDLGDAVWAPGRGKVVYAGFLQMTGNTVVIEHGGGLKSYPPGFPCLQAGGHRGKRTAYRAGGQHGLFHRPAPALRGAHRQPEH